MRGLLEKVMEVGCIMEQRVSREEQEKHFEDRTQMHISLVKDAILKIVEELPELSELADRIETHDESKFLEPERTPYVLVSWKHKCKKDGMEFNCTPEQEKMMHKATLHHIMNNSHHPEYHLEDKSEANIDLTDRDKAVKCIDASRMPNIDVAEMVADWQAMSEELGTNTARQWYDKQKNVRWKFSEEQDNLIDRILRVFE